MTITVKNPGDVVAIPASVRRKAGIKAGDRLEFQVSGNVITIAPADKNSRAVRDAKERRYTESEITKGLSDVRRGRTYGPFRSAEAMAASIEGEISKYAISKRPKRAK